MLACVLRAGRTSGFGIGCRALATGRSPKHRGAGPEAEHIGERSEKGQRWGERPSAAESNEPAVEMPRRPAEIYSPKKPAAIYTRLQALAARDGSDLSPAEEFWKTYEDTLESIRMGNHGYIQRILLSTQFAQLCFAFALGGLFWHLVYKNIVWDPFWKMGDIEKAQRWIVTNIGDDGTTMYGGSVRAHYLGKKVNRMEKLLTYQGRQASNRYGMPISSYPSDLRGVPAEGGKSDAKFSSPGGDFLGFLKSR